jgi:hypothetical protein
VGSSSSHGSWWYSLAGFAVLRGWPISSTALDTPNADHNDTFDLKAPTAFCSQLFKTGDFTQKPCHRVDECNEISRQLRQFPYWAALE